MWIAHFCAIIYCKLNGKLGRPLSCLYILLTQSARTASAVRLSRIAQVLLAIFHEYRTNAVFFHICRPDKAQRRMHHLHGLSWLCKLAMKHATIWTFVICENVQMEHTYIGHFHMRVNSGLPTKLHPNVYLIIFVSLSKSNFSVLERRLWIYVGAFQSDCTNIDGKTICVARSVVWFIIGIHVWI